MIIDVIEFNSTILLFAFYFFFISFFPFSCLPLTILYDSILLPSLVY